jgi:hypothetical protein
MTEFLICKWGSGGGGGVQTTLFVVMIFEQSSGKCVPFISMDLASGRVYASSNVLFWTGLGCW